MGIAALRRRLLVVAAVAGLTAATMAADVSPASAELSPGAASGVSVDGQVLAELADRGSQLLDDPYAFGVGLDITDREVMRQARR